MLTCNHHYHHHSVAPYPNVLDNCKAYFKLEQYRLKNPFVYTGFQGRQNYVKTPNLNWLGEKMGKKFDAMSVVLQNDFLRL